MNRTIEPTDKRAHAVQYDAAFREQTSLRVCSPSEGARGPVALAAENARLQAELRHVTIQRDILKKALAIVGQTSPTATR